MVTQGAARAFRRLPEHGDDGGFGNFSPGPAEHLSADGVRGTSVYIQLWKTGNGKQQPVTVRFLYEPAATGE